MRVTLRAAGFIVFLASQSSASSFSSRKNSTSHTQHGFIVELQPGSSIAGRDESLTGAHSSFHKRAAEVIDYTVRVEFTNPAYFFGLSINVKPGENIELLKDLPEVKNVWVNGYYERPTPFEIQAIPEAFSVNGTAQLRRRDDTVPVTHVTGSSSVNSGLEMTGVDRLHALGIKGKGIKIGIIDSGIDYRHPALGGGIGEGFKVLGGYAFVDDSFDGDNEPIQSSDPLTTCLIGGHGTHVAGEFSNHEEPY
jgi:subtilisin family serine protease